jgi:hypothetical protein
MGKTLKNSPVRGWKKEKPGFHQKTTMLKKCGKKCFLGSKKSFPICKKNTCKVSSKGLYAAYIRGRQYSSKGTKYQRIAAKAKKMLVKMGEKR